MAESSATLGVRDVAAAAGTAYDLLVVGGGIHGIWTALAGAEQGRSVLLIERADFGREASANSLRVLHGGLRYLQSLDLRRFQESVSARREWLLRFPSLTQPLGFLLPLDGQGWRRRTLLAPALRANDVLSAHRNDGMPPGQVIPNGSVRGVNAAELAPLTDLLPRERCREGVACWTDGVIVSPARLHVALLASAVARGARVLNHVEAANIAVQDGAVSGVEAVDLEAGARMRLTASRVINCAGAWAPLLARRWSAPASGDAHSSGGAPTPIVQSSSDPAHRLHPPSMAFNLVFRGSLPLSEGVAVATPTGRQLFLYSRHGRIFAGTQHLAYTKEPAPAEIPDEEVRRFLRELQDAVPGLGLRESDLLAIQPGLLTAKRPGSPWMPKRERILDHGREGGPRGLVSVSGIKYTTAPIVARKALAIAFADDRVALAPGEDRARSTKASMGSSPSPRADAGDLQARSVEAVLDDMTRSMADPAAGAAGGTPLDTWMEREMAVHLDDLLLGRLDGADLGRGLLDLARQLAARSRWTPARREAELSRLEDRLCRSVPAAGSGHPTSR